MLKTENLNCGTHIVLESTVRIIAFCWRILTFSCSSPIAVEAAVGWQSCV